MSYKILVIDDDKPMHIFIDKVLSDEYELIHVDNAQQGIDVLSEESINLVIADIYMPGLSGLDFLQVFKKDARKKQVPVLIMSNLPSDDKKKKALDYGAAEVINKSDIINDHAKLLEKVEAKLGDDTSNHINGYEPSKRKNKLIAKMMAGAQDGGFESLLDALCEDIFSDFNLDYIAFWKVDNGIPKLVCDSDKYKKNSYDFTEDLQKEQVFQKIKEDREPYFTNNVFGEGEGIMQEFSKKHELPAEIGVPIFAISEKKLLLNDMEVPEDAEMFGLYVLKRNKLFTTNEYKMISRLLIQTGSVLWRMFSKSQLSSI